jgi:hypothetical protein
MMAVCPPHLKGKMIGFDEDSFVGTFKCRLCGQPFSEKAAIVCMEKTKKARAEQIRELNRIADTVLNYRPKDRQPKPPKKTKTKKEKNK